MTETWSPPEGLEPLRWDQRIVIDIAMALIGSGELRGALEHAGMTEELLIAPLIASSNELICVEELEFEQRPPRMRDVWSILVKRLCNKIVEILRLGVLGLAVRILVLVAFSLLAIWIIHVAVTVGWSEAGLLVLGGCAILATFWAWVAAFNEAGVAEAVYVLGSDSWDVLTRRVVAPFIRELVNEVVNSPGREQSFHVMNAPGLTELAELEQVVPTAAADRLGRLAGAMAAGSIAISGPRGVGKTTLLQGFCDARFARPEIPELRVLVSAPVDYDFRDFVLHVFGRLCAAITGDPEGAEPWGGGPSDGQRRRLALTAALCAAASTALLVAMFYQQSRQTEFLLLVVNLALGVLLVLLAGAAAGRLIALRQLRRSGVRVSYLQRGLLRLAALGLAAGGIGVISWTLNHERRSYVLPSLQSAGIFGGGILLLASFVFLGLLLRAPRGGRDLPLREEAQRQMQRIRFLQTFTTGYSGTVKLPPGGQIGTTVSRQLAEQQLTLPELVDQYRNFAHRAAQRWRAEHGEAGRLVVGIDEVDKIRDADKAERFVNDIKAVFGSPHCLYLVSVSEEALVGFQQRVPSVRTAFDSAFDEVLRVDHLTFADVRELLRRRIAGISDPFIALCFALSGGLPRDVLRKARALVEVRSGGPSTLVDLSAALIARDLATTKHRVLSQVISDQERAVAPRLIELLVAPQWPDLTEDAILNAASAGENGTWGDVAVLSHLATYLYFLRTVTTVFGSDRKATITKLSQDPSGDACGINRLAQARLALDINAPLAAELINRFRDRRGYRFLDGLPPWQQAPGDPVEKAPPILPPGDVTSPDHP
jgi:hypothetical protein